MQREFLKERTRCRALEEELENPMNVHRWRKLEVTSDRTFLSLPNRFYPTWLLPKAQWVACFYLMLCKLLCKMWDSNVNWVPRTRTRVPRARWFTWVLFKKSWTKSSQPEENPVRAASWLPPLMFLFPVCGFWSTSWGCLLSLGLLIASGCIVHQHLQSPFSWPLHLFISCRR